MWTCHLWVSNMSSLSPVFAVCLTCVKKVSQKCPFRAKTSNFEQIQANSSKSEQLWAPWLISISLPTSQTTALILVQLLLGRQSHHRIRPTERLTLWTWWQSIKSARWLILQTIYPHIVGQNAWQSAHDPSAHSLTRPCQKPQSGQPHPLQSPQQPHLA